MAGTKVAKGDKIQARVHHNGVKSGTVGTVVGVHNGPYYAVNYPGVQGVSYTPDPHAIPVTGAGAGPQSSPVPGGGPASQPAVPVAARMDSATFWHRLMELVTS